MSYLLGLFDNFLDAVLFTKIFAKFYPPHDISSLLHPPCSSHWNGRAFWGWNSVMKSYNSDWIDVQHCCSFYWKIRCSGASLCEIQVKGCQSVILWIIMDVVFEMNINEIALNNSPRFLFCFVSCFELGLRMNLILIRIKGIY